ncbi:hypothetical protein ACJX0J_020062 [Zea mays]
MVQYMFFIMTSTTGLRIIDMSHISAHGSNTIPSLPVNLDSDAEHSVQDINSPEKNAAPVQKHKNHICILNILLKLFDAFYKHHKFFGMHWDMVYAITKLILN